MKVIDCDKGYQFSLIFEYCLSPKCKYYTEMILIRGTVKFHLGYTCVLDEMRKIT